jgi:hypothetical protein
VELEEDFFSEFLASLPPNIKHPRSATMVLWTFRGNLHIPLEPCDWGV